MIVKVFYIDKILPVLIQNFKTSKRNEVNRNPQALSDFISLKKQILYKHKERKKKEEEKCKSSLASQIEILWKKK